MALIYNPTTEEVKVQAFGNYFSFKAGQIKPMTDNLASYLAVDKAYLGFVSLPDSILEEPDSEESKRLKEEAKEQGISNRIRYLKTIIYNLEVSLQRDLEQANIKTNATIYASNGELAAYKELAKYKRAEEDKALAREQEILKLKEQINGDPNAANT